VNQAVRTLSRFEPLETAAPLPSPTHLIAKPVNGHLIEAVLCADTQGYYKGRWLVVERDPILNLIRESTASYADERAAYYAYWYACASEPLDFEAWVSPLFATFTAAA
jgi:hypothetical protein